MITVYIGAVILLAFATLARMKSKSALADALATKIDQIVEPEAGNITNSLDRLRAVWQMIEQTTAEFTAARSTEPRGQSAAAGDRFDAPSTVTRAV